MRPDEELHLAQLTTEAANAESAEIDRLSALEIVQLINREDSRVPGAVAAVAGDIARAIDVIADCFRSGGRLVYVGAGTSGRLGVLDAAECPPTFRTPPEMVVGLIAGGPPALVRAVEGLEDKPEQGAADLADLQLTGRDCVVAIATSGRTPYCIGAADEARRRGAFTVGLVCNQPSGLDAHVDLLIAPIVGPEVITGSTRMKAGTATKMILNMFTTGAMVRIGKTYGNVMVDLRPTNSKLRARARRIVSELCGLDKEEAARVLAECDSEVKTALVVGRTGITPQQAREHLDRAGGHIRVALDELAKQSASRSAAVRAALERARLILGIDGGGTRTIALLADRTGTVVGCGRSGPSNPQVVGFGVSAAAVTAAVEAAFCNAGLRCQPVRTACVGVAGAGRPDDQHLLRQLLERRGLADHIRIVPDAQLLLSSEGAPIEGGTDAAASAGWGVAVVAGTGSIVFGRSSDGTVARAGGWGPIVGDEGSAYWIARQALEVVTRAADGRGAESNLSGRVLGALSLEKPEQLAGHLAHATRSELARLAPLVDQAAQEGDEAAAEIIDRAARELGDQVLAVAGRLCLASAPVPMVFAGGALLGSARLRVLLCEYLKANALDVRARMVAEPALGAVKLAMQWLGGNERD